MNPSGQFLRAALYTAAFAAIHSLLASSGAKSWAARLAGTRGRDTWYRAAYNLQAAGTTAALVVWLSRTPGQDAYEVKGATAYLMRAAQAGALAAIASSIYSAGVANFLGVRQLGRGLMLGDPGPLTIDAQGPARTAEGHLMITGLFRRQRHPTNFWALVLLWLQPRMTYSGLGFSVAASVYLLAGSYHQDVRLRRSYGRAFDEYRHSGVPLFFPRVSVVEHGRELSTSRL